MNLRPVTFDDAELLLAWRNDPDALKNSSNTLPVSEQSHNVWMNTVMMNSDIYVYIAEIDGAPVGQGRIERAWKAISKKMDSALLGYSIDKHYRQKGYGTELCSLLVNLATKHHGYAQTLCRIKRTNMCSVKVAIAAGVHVVEFF